MRERWAKWLAACTGALVLLLSVGFALLQNRTTTVPPSSPESGVTFAAGVAPDTAAAERRMLGRRVYDEQGCSRCHSIAGQGSPRSPLDGVGARLDGDALRAFVIGDDSVADRLAPRTRASKRDFAELPAEQLDALVEYLASLR